MKLQTPKSRQIFYEISIVQNFGTAGDCYLDYPSTQIINECYLPEQNSKSADTVQVRYLVCLLYSNMLNSITQNVCRDRKHLPRAKFEIILVESKLLLSTAQVERFANIGNKNVEVFDTGLLEHGQKYEKQ